MRWVCGLLLVSQVLLVVECRGEYLDVFVDDHVVSFQTGSHSSHTTTLRIANHSASAAEVAVWQVGLIVVPDAAAVGTVEISGWSTPDNYLLAGRTPFGPMASFDPALPGVAGFFSDVAFGSPSGGVMTPAQVFNLLNLTLAISPDAAGDFALVLQPFADGLKDSSWAESGVGVARPFSNESLEAPLLRLSLVEIPEPSCAAQIVGASMLALGRLYSWRSRRFAYKLPGGWA